MSSWIATQGNTIPKMKGLMYIALICSAHGAASNSNAVILSPWSTRAYDAVEDLLSVFWNNDIDYLQSCVPWQQRSMKFRRGLEERVSESSSATSKFLQQPRSLCSSLGYWGYARGFHTVAIAASTNKTFIPFLHQMYEAQARAGWDRPFYDDLNWMYCCTSII